MILIDIDDGLIQVYERKGTRGSQKLAVKVRKVDLGDGYARNTEHYEIPRDAGAEGYPRLLKEYTRIQS